MAPTGLRHRGRRLRRRVDRPPVCATMGDEVVAVVRDPSTAGSLRDIGARVVAGDLSSNWAIRGRRWPAATRSSTRRVVPDRHPEVRAAGDVRGERRASPSASSTPRSPSGSRASSTSRRSTSSATRTAGSSTRRTGATCGRVPELLRRDEVPRPQAARRRIEAGAPIVIVMPGTIYGPGDHSDRRAAQGRLRRHGAVHRPR